MANGVVGYYTTIKIGGTPTEFTGETMTDTGDKKTFQIDTATREIWDLETTPTFYDDGVEVDPTSIASIDYLFGKVTFKEETEGPITVDGKYIPTVKVSLATNYSLNMVSTIHDQSDFERLQEGGGHRIRSQGIHDVGVTLTRFEDVTQRFRDALLSRKQVLIEIQPGGPDNNGPIFRGWFVVEQDSLSGGVDELETADVSFQISGDQRETGTTFAWSE